ncbi:SNF2-related, N-terminal domain-containing protein [Artemisia annua]|uniref:SNF2-related, N-terminal domain-containing protein n=1 Tax=Artemisia annua TaxID=35608 RepID=A0A2U1PMW6_ARTAN|nr:SNF2-related, N-terminal domain-containing protein [Artemisia annua]
MSSGSPCSYQWQFDNDDVNDNLNSPATVDDVDFESFFSTQNAIAGTSSSILPCSETASHGANQHSETHNGSLVLPLLHDSAASASRAFCSSGLSVTESQTSNSGFDKLEPHQDVFPMHFTGSVGDWQMPFPEHVNHEVTQGYPSFSNDPFGLTNSSSYDDYQLMDKAGVVDGIFDNSVGNSFNTLEVPDNMDLGRYSNMIYDPNHEFSMPHVTNIDGPFYFGSSRQGQSSNLVKTESEKHRMQNVPICNAMNYDIVAARPDGIALVDQNSDIGPYVNAEGSDFLPRGESSLSEPAKESTSGYHGLRPCNTGNKRQAVSVKNKNRVPTSKGGAPRTNMPKKAKLKAVDEPSGQQDPSVPTSKDGAPRTKMRKKAKLKAVDELFGQQDPSVPTSKGGAPRTNMRKKPKLKTVDELSGQQVPSQDLLLRKPRKPLPDDGLAVPLLKHQRIALSWMSKRETKSTRCCGGILADDQGLGKTISAIALILKERSPPYSSVNAIGTNEKDTETLCLDDDEDEDIEHTNTSVQTKSSLAAGTLVVCPTSVLRQWNDELQNKVINEANLSVLVYYGVNRTKDPFELAKYDVVLTTYAIVGMEVPKQPIDEDEDETKIKISPNKKRKYPPTSDESPKKEPSESIDRPLAKLRWFRVILDEAQSIKNYKTQAARACWGLRAKRRWCLSGTPIQNSVDDLYSYFRFLRYDPFAIFRKFCSEIKAPIQRNPVSGYKKLQIILKTIMLRRTKGTLLKGEPIISLPPKTIMLKKVDFTAEERGFYQSLEAEARAQFEEYAAAGTVKQNYINILLMLLRLRQACDHPSLVRESRLTTDWKLSLEKAKELSQEKLNRLVNCLEASLAICSICNDPPEDAVVTTCEHVFCNQCILEHLSSDDSQCPSSECKELLSRSTVFCKSTLKICISADISSSGSVKSEDLEPSSSNGPIDSLKIEATKALESSKIKAALEVLRSISKPEDITVNDTNIKNPVTKGKAIVFSQWTGMLDLVEVCLKDSCMGYRRLDGTMSVVARDKAVKDFNTLPEVTVMIMSLKAASLGLNMVAACHVILLDLWWNPTTEDQAIDRAHRIGQTRPVTVFRFTVKDTIEDRILALQKRKRQMVESAFGDDKNGGSEARLTVADMEYLFQA